MAFLVLNVFIIALFGSFTHTSAFAFETSHPFLTPLKGIKEKQCLIIIINLKTCYFSSHDDT